MGSPPARTGKTLFETIKDWCLRHPHWLLTLLTVAALAPFLSKPFNIDDPLFIWTGQQIQSHPGNPYGFTVNWFGFSQPMWQATLNPPLMSYYLATVAGIFGWSETGLHFMCLLPTVAAVLGTYRLATHLCQRPMLAAVLTLFAPVFFVSATTVMCDVPMLTFWVWAVTFWIEGIKQDNFWKLSAAGLLVALAVLTKFNGLCLIPLLAAHGLIKKRTLGRWAIFLMIPVAVLSVYEWLTFHFYGEAHFLASTLYTQTHQTFHGLAKLTKVLNTLTFTGGCFAAALFCAPFLWRGRALAGFTGVGVVLVALAIAIGMMSKNYPNFAGGNLVSVVVQILFWTVGGVCVLALVVEDTWQKRDADAWLLALWILGTFAYAAFVYWMVNARAILPMAPAVAILIVRGLGQTRATLPARIKYSLGACAALCLVAAQADLQQAVAARKGAEQACAKYIGATRKVWFEGHWGFQYYMQAAGARPLDFNGSKFADGDILVVPGLNSNNHQIGHEMAAVCEIFSLPELSWFATMNPAVGAGFYSQFDGPLPFAFGLVSPENFSVFYLKVPAKNSD